MQFLLSELEQHVDDTSLLLAESLLEEGLVKELEERERHLWTAMAGDYEVEMQISPSKVKACSCQCPGFAPGRLCGHVAAGLISLRALLDSQRLAEKKPEALAKKARERQLSIPAILREVSHAELVEFVSNHARFNRQFSLSLKARFAGKIQLFDNRLKYQRILEPCLQPIRRQRSRPSTTSLLFLQQILDTLQEQASEAMALGHHAAAWHIISATLEQVAPMLRKMRETSDTIPDLIAGFFTQFRLLAQADLSRALREEILLFSLRNFPRPAYCLNGHAATMLEVAGLLSDEPSQKGHLLQLLDAELLKAGLPAGHRGDMLLAKARLLQLEEFSDLRDEFTLHCLSAPTALLEVIEALGERGQLGLVRPLLEQGIRLLPDDPLRQRVQQSLLEVAQHQGDIELALQLSRSLFLRTHRIEYLDSCRKNCTGDWSIFVHGLTEEMARQPDRQQQLPALAVLLAREKQTSKLLQLLQEQPSLDVLLEIDHHLLPDMAEELFQLYEGTLKLYLTSHLGPAPARKVRQVMDRLRSLGQQRMSERLFASLSGAFPSRLSLFRMEVEVEKRT